MTDEGEASTEGLWTEIPEDRTPAVKSNSYPRYLYRYRSFSQDNYKPRINFEIGEEAVYLSGLDELNDPDEGGPDFRLISNTESETDNDYFQRLIANESISAHADELRKRKAIVKKNLGFLPDSIVEDMVHAIQKRTRVACFSTDPLSPVMWSHYGSWVEKGKNKVATGGICIQYLTSESWRRLGLRRVTYSRHRPVINLSETDAKIDSDMFFACATKALEWAYEDEWRIFGTIDSMDFHNPKFTSNSKYRLQNSVSGIFVGFNAPPKLFDAIFGTLDAKKMRTPVYLVERSRIHLGLTATPVKRP